MQEGLEEGNDVLFSNDRFRDLSIIVVKEEMFQLQRSQDEVPPYLTDAENESINGRKQDGGARVFVSGRLSYCETEEEGIRADFEQGKNMSELTKSMLPTMFQG